MISRNMLSERGRWVKIADFYTWQILKFLSAGPKGVRDIQSSGFAGSPKTLEEYIERLLGANLISENKMERWPFKRVLRINDSGRKVLDLFDQIGEIVKECRKGGEEHG